VPDALPFVDEARAIHWLRRAVQTPSITGQEGAFARLVADELRASGAEEVQIEEVAPGRPIVWSVTRGRGSGPNLLLCGHLDTVRVDGWSERWRGTEREDPFSAALVDGAIWGRGTVDLKGGIAAALAALRTLHTADDVLDGDVVTAWVCDEESGEQDTGHSIGMQALVELVATARIPLPSFAIYTEPTQLAVFSAQIGFLIAEIDINGRSAYFGRPEEGIDALHAAHRVLTELWELAEELPTRHSHPLVGDSKLLVTEARAGGYIAVPGSCKLALIRSLVPGEDLDEAAAEIEAAVTRGLKQTGADATVSFPAGRDHPLGGLPAETPPTLEPVQRLIQTLLDLRPSAATVAAAPYWSEMSFLAAAGVPCVYWGPGDVSTAHTVEEHVDVKEFLDAVRVLTNFIAGHCCAGPSKGGQQ
jgi:acetylornithine deacetylase